MTTYAMPNHACHPCQVEWRLETAGMLCWMCGRPGGNTWALGVHTSWLNAAGAFPELEPASYPALRRVA